MSDKEIKRITSIKYLGALIDERLTWNDHITVIENTVSKHFWPPVQSQKGTRQHSIRKSVFFIYTQLLALWKHSMGQHKQNKTKPESKQKLVLRIINNELTGIRKIMVRMEVLNIFELNIYQILNFMLKIKTNTTPCIF